MEDGGSIIPNALRARFGLSPLEAAGTRALPLSGFAHTDGMPFEFGHDGWELWKLVPEPDD